MAKYVEEIADIISPNDQYKIYGDSLEEMCNSPELLEESFLGLVKEIKNKSGKALGSLVQAREKKIDKFQNDLENRLSKDVDIKKIKNEIIKICEAESDSIKMIMNTVLENKNMSPSQTRKYVADKLNAVVKRMAKAISAVLRYFKADDIDPDYVIIPLKHYILLTVIRTTIVIFVFHYSHWLLTNIKHVLPGAVYDASGIGSPTVATISRYLAMFVNGVFLWGAIEQRYLQKGAKAGTNHILYSFMVFGKFFEYLVLKFAYGKGTDTTWLFSLKAFEALMAWMKPRFLDAARSNDADRTVTDGMARSMFRLFSALEYFAWAASMNFGETLFGANTQSGSEMPVVQTQSSPSSGKILS